MSFEQTTSMIRYHAKQRGEERGKKRGEKIGEKRGIIVEKLETVLSMLKRGVDL